MDTSTAASRRAAERHARVVAAGPPRHARWTAWWAAVSGVGAAVAWPLLRPAALVLTALAVLLLAVHRQDRRDAWRYLPEPGEPGRVLPPLLPLPAQGDVLDDRPRPAVPVVKEVHVPTQPVPIPDLPRPRTPVARPAEVLPPSALPSTVGDSAARALTVRKGV